jgi:hypothetical protein
MTLMLGSFVSSAYQTTPTVEAEQFFTGLVRWAGIEVPFETSGSPVEVRYTESGSDILLFVFNHDSETVAEATLTFNDGGARFKAFDLVRELPVALEREGDRLSLRSRIDPMDVRVVRLMRQ